MSILLSESAFKCKLDSIKVEKKLNGNYVLKILICTIDENLKIYLKYLKSYEIKLSVESD